MLRIRYFEPKDTQDVAAVILPIQQDEFGIAVTLEDQPDLGNIPQFYQQGCGNFWVAEYDGRIAGTIGLLDIGGKQAALRKMFVAQPFRGREHSVAKLLLDEVFRWSASKAIAEIYLGTTDKFLAAHRFYEKNGFVEIAKPDLPGTFPVMAVDSKFYRRVLSRDDA